MKQRVHIVAAIAGVILLLVLAACGQKAVDKWQEQYDLGVRYLSEGNYEEAIIAFTAAIEIDPNQAKVYQDLAYAYIGQNDFDAAADILRQGIEKTQDEQLCELLEDIENGNIRDYFGNIRKETVYDKDGNILHIYTYTYDNRGYETGWTDITYSGDEVERGYAIVEFGADGYPEKNIYYNEDGSLEEVYDLMTYNELGQEVERRKYFPDHMRLFRFFYDEDGKKIRHDVYDDGETLSSYVIYEYDEDGELIGETSYHADGSIMGNTVYD